MFLLWILLGITSMGYYFYARLDTTGQIELSDVLVAIVFFLFGVVLLPIMAICYIDDQIGDIDFVVYSRKSAK